MCRWLSQIEVITETPLTVDTEIDDRSSPRCASTASYQYSHYEQQTETDEEWQRDTPVSFVEIPAIYAEGMHSDRDKPSDFITMKITKIVPTALEF